MNGFVIENLINEQYDKFLLCLTFESIINYLNDIESSDEISGKSGKLIIDQLLVTGNGKNRFICCNFHDGKIDISSTKNANPSDNIKRESVRLLKEYSECCRYSILTEDERQCIEKGLIF